MKFYLFHLKKICYNYGISNFLHLSLQSYVLTRWQRQCNVYELYVDHIEILYFYEIINNI